MVTLALSYATQVMSCLPVKLGPVMAMDGGVAQTPFVLV